jgi:hypothetical protein
MPCPKQHPQWEPQQMDVGSNLKDKIIIKFEEKHKFAKYLAYCVMQWKICNS